MKHRCHAIMLVAAIFIVPIVAAMVAIHLGAEAAAQEELAECTGNWDPEPHHDCINKVFCCNNGAACCNNVDVENGCGNGNDWVATTIDPDDRIKTGECVFAPGIGCNLCGGQINCSWGEKQDEEGCNFAACGGNGYIRAVPAGERCL